MPYRDSESAALHVGLVCSQADGEEDASGCRGRSRRERAVEAKRETFAGGEGKGAEDGGEERERRGGVGIEG